MIGLFHSKTSLRILPQRPPAPQRPVLLILLRFISYGVLDSQYVKLMASCADALKSGI